MRASARPAPPLVVVAVLLAFGSPALVGASPRASASPPSSPASSSAIPSGDPSTASSAPVLVRMATGGGFAPLPGWLMHVPTFTLYADGRAIFRPADAVSEDGAAAPLRVTTLDGGQVDRLVAAVLDEAGLRDARSEYAVEGVADATTTVFTVEADGVSRTVSVYGLGFGDRGPDRQAIRRFERLGGVLADFEAWLPPDARVSDYQAALYRGVFSEDDPEGPGLIPWPWIDLSPVDLVPLEDAPAFSQVDLSQEQASLVAVVPTGGAFDIPVASPDGLRAWRLSLRPLLPDEAPQAARLASPPPWVEEEYGY